MLRPDEMAQFTRLTDDDARSIASAFGLGDVARLEGLEVGTVNSNYFLTAGGRDWFLRVNEGKDEDEVRYEAELLEHLAARGVPTPPVVRSLDGTPWLVWQGRFVTLFPRVGGAHRLERRTEDDLAAVGRALARLHLAGEDFPLRRESRYSFHRIVQRRRGIPAQPPGALATALADVDDEIAWLSEREAARAALPSGVIHGDLFPDNVLLETDGSLSLLDFEQASDGTFAYDLAVTLCAWCFVDDFVHPLCRGLRAGYSSVRPLTREERELLWIEARAAAMRFTVTRITDVELNPSVPGERRAAKSYRRFHARLLRLRELGPSGFADLVALR
jgi:homoserine kinase type II